VRRLAPLLDLLLVVLGVVLIVAGVSYWSLPGAILVAGMACVAGGIAPFSSRRPPPPAR
jgi:membrane-bound ClpP family serine protease